MAINSDNLFTDGFRGTVGGNMTFRRTKSGKVIVSKKRKASEEPPTEGQVTTQNRFRRGIVYATNMMKDLVKKALYGTKVKGDQSAFNVAMKDYCVSPEVVSIHKEGYTGAVGDIITIEATDDFKVESVAVAIHGSDGSMLEQGAAVSADGLSWTYTVTQANAALAGTKITATASDIPGNTDVLEVTL